MILVLAASRAKADPLLACSLLCAFVNSLQAVSISVSSFVWVFQVAVELKDICSFCHV